MSESVVSYKFENGIATITMNDGGKNLISPTMIQELNKALDQAEKDGAVVIITGQEGIFSAGFDLKILKSGAKNTYDMLIGGFQLSARLLTFPLPTIIACNGHAIAMGVFLLLSADYRIGSAGQFKIMANEVAIGLTLPYSAIEICRQRLNPAHFERATLLSECYDPASAVAAGFMDEVVTNDKLMATALQKAESYTKLDLKAHRESKLRVRKHTNNNMKNAIGKDRLNFVKLGVSRLVKK